MAHRLPLEETWRCDGCGQPVTGSQNHSGCTVRGHLGTTPAVIIPPEGTLYGEVVSKALFVQDPQDQIDNAVLGIAGEAGEIADSFKKAKYHPGKTLDKEAIRLEIGDVLFYLALLNQNLFGDSLLDVARDNIRKLQKRWPDRYVEVNLGSMRL